MKFLYSYIDIIMIKPTAFPWEIFPKNFDRKLFETRSIQNTYWTGHWDASVIYTKTILIWTLHKYI